MVLVGTDGRVVHVCSSASSYPFDSREWWTISFFDLRRKYMIRVAGPPIFVFEAAFKMRLMLDPPRELPGTEMVNYNLISEIYKKKIGKIQVKGGEDGQHLSYKGGKKGDQRNHPKWG
jgi:hypothetical protein